MSSDYIYIFCIPSTLPQITSATSARQSAHSVPAEALYANDRTESGAQLSMFVESVGRIRRPHQALRSSHQIRQFPPAMVDVPNDWGPLPVRQRDNSQVVDMNVVHSVHSSRLGSGRTVVAGPDDVQNPGYQVGALSEFAAQNSPSSQDGLGFDVNGNATTTDAICCLPQCPQIAGSSTSQNTTADENRCSCSSTVAKNCWQQVCSHACLVRCVSAATFTSFRCLLMFFASLGIGCIVSGVVLGILRMTVGSSFLVLSFMFIGLGILLIIVVLIGWRCTPVGNEPCNHMMEQFLNRTAVARGHYERRNPRDHMLDPSQWFGGVIYPEFRSRTPPPPYSVLTIGAQGIEQCTSESVVVRGDLQVYPDTPPPAYRVYSSSSHGTGTTQLGHSTRQVHNHSAGMSNAICELSASSFDGMSPPAIAPGDNALHLDRRHSSKAHAVDSRLGILHTMISAKSYQRSINQLPELSISCIETDHNSTSACPPDIQNAHALPASSPDLVTESHLEDSFVAIHQPASILDRSFRVDESTDDSLDSVD